MIDDSFDVNSELYFNEKLNLWLNNISANDVKQVLRDCFGIPLSDVHNECRIWQWDSYDVNFREYGRFDQKIDFGKVLCVILELKVSTEATVGQIDKYLSYIGAAGYKSGYVILMTRNELASQKLGYGELLKKNSNLLFVTWGQFESHLNSIANKLEAPKKHTENFLYLLSFLTDIQKRSERLIDQASPPPFEIQKWIGHLTLLPEPKRKGHFLAWNNREVFWEELIERLIKHTQYQSFSAFRFDFYEYLMRWAFHEKNIYLDIYEDKNYEYLYNYFIQYIYPEKGKLLSAQYSELYYRFLLIRKTEVLATSNHFVFYRLVGKKWYICIVQKNATTSNIKYVKLFNLKFV